MTVKVHFDDAMHYFLGFIIHYENLPMQYTEMLKVVKNEKLQRNNVDFF